MGLLSKAATENPQVRIIADYEDIWNAVYNFYNINSLYHCIVMEFAGNQQQALADIAEMTAFHGALCYSFPDNKGLVLLPGGLDMELFSNRLSKSTGSTVLFQFSANSSAVALETLIPYLG